MFSYEQRTRAINLLIQYDMAYSTVLRELGYPSRQGLIKWYKEYIEYGDLHKESRRGRGKSYSDKERNTAINYYLEHGKCIAKTCA